MDGTDVDKGGDTANFHTFLRWLPDLGLGVYVSVNTTSPVPLPYTIGLRALGLMVTAKTGRMAPVAARAAPVVRVSAGRCAALPGATPPAPASTSSSDPAAGCDGSCVAPARCRSVTMLPRADGWYAAVPAGHKPLTATWINPATVAGRHSS